MYPSFSLPQGCSLRFLRNYGAITTIWKWVLIQLDFMADFTSFAQTPVCVYVFVHVCVCICIKLYAAFNTCIEPCNQHRGQDIKVLSPQGFLGLLFWSHVHVSLPFPYYPLGTADCFSFSVVLLFQEYYVSGMCVCTCVQTHTVCIYYVLFGLTFFTLRNFFERPASC